MPTQTTITPESILVGAATLKVGSYGCVEASMRDVGATDGGVEVSFATEKLEIEVDQAYGPVKTVKTKESMTVKASLAEATLENIALAFGYPSSAVAGDVFSFGGDNTIPEFQVIFYGTGPNGKERKVTLWKCNITGNTSMAYKKGEKVLIPVEIQVLADTTKPDKQRFGKIEDLAADATAPTVTGVTPANNATAVAVSSNVQITFSEDMQAATINPATVLLLNASTGAAVAGSVAYDSSTRKATFTPSANLSAATAYLVVVTTAVKDLAGNALAAAYNSKFTTA
ncbi:MAG TPA: Ig-like domain-containing protein [Firmicutes bacterium]|nr:Ig-like domain-containing protein [Bacillota bacterium]